MQLHQSKQGSKPYVHREEIQPIREKSIPRLQVMTGIPQQFLEKNKVMKANVMKNVNEWYFALDFK